MNLEDVMARLAQLDSAIDQHNKQIQQTVANLNMLQGGRSECLIWIQRLKESESVKASTSIDAEKELIELGQEP